MTTVLIIEDEIKTARLIKNLIEADDEFTVAGMVPSVKGALAWLSQNSPGLILSDIQLADGLSFEIFRQAGIQVPVIFCTAFDEYAINAFKANGIDYLLKPIEEEKLQQSLAKFKSMKALFAPKDDYSRRLGTALNKLHNPYKTTMLIHHRERIIPLKMEDISVAHSENGIVTLYVKDTMRYHVNHTLEELEAMMDPAIFFKVNRQFIVNRNAIAGAEHYFSRRLLVRVAVKAPAEIIVSKARTQAFLKWMEQ
ncbi:LytR/AlgR family response regulator transcription factor [Flavobacterium sp. RHBU_24]|uniref:LytR/AlgR family response regulator transcription factor n=1 Tax=Flavobacterium sp. RHBU_24 TaxID=3391185 RepID=UPI00398507F2